MIMVTSRRVKSKPEGLIWEDIILFGIKNWPTISALLFHKTPTGGTVSDTGQFSITPIPGLTKQPRLGSIISLTLDTQRLVGMYVGVTTDGLLGIASSFVDGKYSGISTMNMEAPALLHIYKL
jgi:hypothetical protein